MIDQRSFIKVDVFVPPSGPLGEGQLARTVRLELVAAAPPLPVLGPEDVVLQKLARYRAGGEVSDRQWRDVVSVVRSLGADLDAIYLDEVASVTGLGELLGRALGDARTR